MRRDARCRFWIELFSALAGLALTGAPAEARASPPPVPACRLDSDPQLLAYVGRAVGLVRHSLEIGDPPPLPRNEETTAWSISSWEPLSSRHPMIEIGWARRPWHVEVLEGITVELVKDARSDAVDAGCPIVGRTGTSGPDSLTVAGICEAYAPARIRCSSGAVRALVEANPDGNALLFLMGHEVAHLLRGDPTSDFISWYQIPAQTPRQDKVRLLVANVCKRNEAAQRAELDADLIGAWVLGLSSNPRTPWTSPLPGISSSDVIFGGKAFEEDPRCSADLRGKETLERLWQALAHWQESIGSPSASTRASSDAALPAVKDVLCRCKGDVRIPALASGHPSTQARNRQVLGLLAGLVGEVRKQYEGELQRYKEAFERGASQRLRAGVDSPPAPAAPGPSVGAVHVSAGSTGVGTTAPGVTIPFDLVPTSSSSEPRPDYSYPSFSVYPIKPQDPCVSRLLRSPLAGMSQELDGMLDEWLGKRDDPLDQDHCDELEAGQLFPECTCDQR